MRTSKRRNFKFGIVLLSLFLCISGNLFSQYTIQIGAGTATNGTSGAAPINIYYRSLHCQTIYTAAELTAAGANPGNILEMGYYIYNAPVNALPNFTVKMKHTTATLPTTYDGTGLTQVYLNTLYAPVVNTWDMLTLDTPFLWDGVSNILVDVCFDQVSAWNSSGRVYTYTETNGFRYIRNDYSSQCGVATSSNASTKPQIKFTFAPLYANDAMIDYFVSEAVCEGLTDVSVFVKNNGSANIDTVTVNWSVNNVLQTPVSYTTTIPSFQGATVSLGGYSFTTGNLYDVLAWTSMPNGMADDNTANDTLGLYDITTGTSGTYTIGSTGDFTSFTTALHWLDSLGLCGPVEFLVSPGTYNEQLAITAIAGASTTNTITFTGQGDATKISYSPSASNLPVIGLDAASHFVFDSLLVEVLGAQGWAFNFMNQSDSNTVRNCHITLPGIATEHKGICAINSLDGSVIVGNNANYLLVENNLIESGNQGIHVQGSTPFMTGNKFIGNTLLEFGFIGMNLSSNTQMDVLSNTLTSNIAGARNAITMWPTGILTNVIGNNIYVNSNVANTRLIQVANEVGGGGAGGDIVIANNMVQYAGTSSTEACCIYTKNTSYLKVYHNTTKTASGAGSRGIWLDALGPDTNVELKNNNMASYVSGSNLLIKHASVSAISSNNNFYNPNGFSVYWNTSYTSLSSFQSASGDVGSVSLDPMFVSSTDLHINTANFFLNGLGTPLAAITTDIDGDVRSSITPDMGADEYVLTPNDAGIVNLPGIYGMCPGLTTIVATVACGGSNPLSSVIIDWEIDGVLQTPINYTTLIPVGGFANVTLGTYTFAAGTTYDISVWTSLPNGVADLNPGNDTLALTGVSTSIFGTFTIGATGDFVSFNDAVDHIVSTGVCGPVEFVVDPGTYPERITIPSILGASSANTITFRSMNNDSTSVIMTAGATGSSDNWLVKMDGADYVTFKGIKFMPTNTTYSNSILFLNSAKYNTFTNNYFVAPGTGTSTNQAHVRCEDVNSSYNTVSLNRFTSGSTAVFMKGVSASSSLNGVNIWGNIIEGFQWYGIRLEYVNSPIVDANEVTSSVSGTGTKMGISIIYANDSLRVTRNKIVLSNFSNTQGINLENIVSTANSKGLIANNFVSILNGTNFTYAVRMYLNCHYQDIYYNSVYVNGNSSSDTRGLNIIGGGNNRVFNNNVMSVRYPTLYEGVPSPVIASDYNNFYSTNSAYAYYPNTWMNYTSLAALAAATGFETNSISVDPNFLSTSNLHAFNTDLIGAAMPFPEITEDIDGQLRDSLAPTIGADEFMMLAIDAGIIQIVGPTGMLIEGQTQIPVVILKNFGTSDLTSCDISYTVGGIPSGSYTWTGLLAQSQTDTVELPGFIVPGSAQQLCAFTELTGDLEPVNDMACMSFDPLPNACNYAMQFDGNNDWIEIPNDASLNSTDYTLEAWIKPSAFSWLDGIISRYPGSGPSGYVLRLSPTSPYNKINFNEADANYTLSTNTWYHLAAVRANGVNTVYINGVAYAVAGNAMSGANNALIQIGCDYNERYWNGLIDEVRIWGTGVSQADIIEWANKPVTATHPNYANLMGYWNFDQPSSAMVPDQKNSNDGIIHEAIFVTSDAPFVCAQYDASIASIISPISGAYLTSTEIVTVEIENGGLDSISNFGVGFSVNGIGVTETISDTIAPGSTLLYTFTNTANLFQTGYGTYDFCAYTMLSTDEYTPNDTLCSPVTNYGAGMACSTALPYEFVNDPAVTDSISSGESGWWELNVLGDYTNVAISLCGSSFDTKLELYNSCTGASIASNDNSCGTQSQLDIPTLFSGTTYYVRVFGATQSAFGNYTLNITGTAAAPFNLLFDPTMVSCNGAADGSIDLTVFNIIGVPPFSFVWLTGDTSEDISGLAAGTYLVTVSDSGGSSVTGQVVITEQAALSNSATATGVTAIGANNGSITNSVSGGTAPYTYLWSNGATTANIENVYAGNYSVIITDANNCQLIETIYIPTPVPTGWQVTPTPISHTIDVAQNSTITLDGNNVAPGSLIGIFYNQSGTMVCGGFTVWSGIATSLVAYGATTGLDNGFQTGETFTWKLYEASLAVEHGGSACYLPLYPQTNTFLSGGSSAINCLNAQSIVIHPISLPAGWSIWSTYVTPVDPSMIAIYDSIVNFVTIVKSGSGLIYWPLYGVNSIGNMVTGQGYQVKMTTAKILYMAGTLIDPVISPINIPSGWSIIAYLRTSQMDAAAVLTPVVTSIVIVKSGSGLIYWPQYGVNSIGNMIPGQGYQIKMTQAATLYFPANTAPSSKSDYIQPQPEKYIGVPNTGHNMSLGILDEAWDVSPQEGDEIGVYNANGELIGSGVYQNGFNAITVWGDDSSTDEKECISEGQSFRLKLWQFAQNSEQELMVETWAVGNDKYSTDAISVIEKMTVVSEDGNDFVLYQNKPNPFQNSTEIEFYVPETSQVSISVFNSIGEKVSDIVSKKFEKGKFSVTFDATELPAGTYFYQFKSDKFTQTKALSLVK
ncbi:MAG: T9SS type A sorting domain-containing protein [Bacteroidales bacterium]|nr:T9SS type A sorting domain-containing protein [Bacteroidales bacterium]MCF8455164.1 T9SS type A sorting domain-containing protein [Bacteroidales bacterium]